jgi:hypothetical protein
MLDRNGVPIGLGTPVRYEHTLRGEQVTRVGTVREMIFRADSCGIKVSGLMNRVLSPDDVTVCDLSTREQRILDAFAKRRIVLDADEIKGIAQEIAGEELIG